MGLVDTEFLWIPNYCVLYFNFVKEEWNVTYIACYLLLLNYVINLKKLPT
jgi:hypothetical protein